MVIGINASFVRKEATGIGQYTINLVKEMAKMNAGKNQQFVLYLEEETGREFLPEAQGFSVKVLKTPIYQRDDLVRRSTWEKLILPAEARRDKVDIFFSPYNAASFFPMTRHVITLHDVVWKVFEKEYINNFRKKLYVGQTFEAINRSQHLITVSEYSKKEINKHLGIAPQFITVIKNGVSTEFGLVPEKRQVQHDLKRLNIDAPYILYVGGLEKRKNVEILLRAFKKAIEGYANIFGRLKLVVVGDYSVRNNPLLLDLEGAIEGLGIREHVILTGVVNEKDLVSLYNGAELFVFPSVYEGFGMPILEAMACGCPVLSSSATSLPEVGGEAVEYFNPLREDELIQQLVRLFSDKEKLEQLSLKGLKRSAEFSWKKAAEKTLGVLLGTVK